MSLELGRFDIQKGNGTVKFVFEDHFWGLQLEGATGQLLHIEQRRANLIERIHDGSIVDQTLGIDGGWFKLFYTTVMALVMFTLTGFWLWYWPKRMRHGGA